MIHETVKSRAPFFGRHAIALASAMVLGLGVNSTARAQATTLSAQETIQ